MNLPSERLETPNAALRQAMKSADPIVRREAEKTFLMKHFFPMTDFAIGEAHPELIGIQRHLMERIKQESGLLKHTIEELFEQKPSPYMPTDPPRKRNSGLPRIEGPSEGASGPKGSAIIEGEFTETFHQPSGHTDKTASTMAEALEEKAGEISKKITSIPKKLAFGVAAVALVGTMGWFAFKRKEEKANGRNDTAVTSR